MASKYQIEMDFSRANQKAQELDEIAADLSKLSNTDLENTLQGLNNEWKGENATKYIQKGTLLKGKISNTAANLKSVASTIRTIARNTYNAEMEALRIAEQREAAARAAAAAAEAARKAAEEAANRTGTSSAGSSGGGHTSAAGNRFGGGGFRR